MIAWRHRPVIAGGMAAPDPPPRILTTEPLKVGLLVAATVAGAHCGRRRSEAADGVPAPPIMAFASMPRMGSRPWAAVLRGPGGWAPGRGAGAMAASFAARSAMPVPVGWPGLARPARAPTCLGGWLDATGAAPQRHLSGRVTGNRGARPRGGPGPRGEELSTRRNAGAAGAVTPRWLPWRTAGELPARCSAAPAATGLQRVHVSLAAPPMTEADAFQLGKRCEEVLGEGAWFHRGADPAARATSRPASHPRLRCPPQPGHPRCAWARSLSSSATLRCAAGWR